MDQSTHRYWKSSGARLERVAGIDWHERSNPDPVRGTHYWRVQCEAGHAGGAYAGGAGIESALVDVPAADGYRLTTSPNLHSNATLRPALQIKRNPASNRSSNASRRLSLEKTASSASR